MSLPQLELSLISAVNFLEALGLGGAALPCPAKLMPTFLEHTWDWMCSHTRLNLRILPAQRSQIVRTKRTPPPRAASRWIAIRAGRIAREPRI